MCQIHALRDSCDAGKRSFQRWRHCCRGPGSRLRLLSVSTWCTWNKYFKNNIDFIDTLQKKPCFTVPQLISLASEEVGQRNLWVDSITYCTTVPCLVFYGIIVTRIEITKLSQNHSHLITCHQSSVPGDISLKLAMNNIIFFLSLWKKLLCDFPKFSYITMLLAKCNTLIWTLSVNLKTLIKFLLQTAQFY